MTQQIGNELPEIESLMSPERQTAPPGTESPLPGESIYSEKRATQALEQGVPAQPAQSSTSQQTMAQFVASATSQPVSIGQTSSTGSPQIADDTDLIEKDWVIKAKEIVERTKHDPYLQNKDVERLKADYMQKRYNKEVKLTED